MRTVRARRRRDAKMCCSSANFPGGSQSIRAAREGAGLEQLAPAQEQRAPVEAAAQPLPGQRLEVLDLAPPHALRPGMADDVGESFLGNSQNFVLQVCVERAIGAADANLKFEAIRPEPFDQLGETCGQRVLRSGGAQVLLTPKIAECNAGADHERDGECYGDQNASS